MKKKQPKEENVKVIVRCRPISHLEKQNGCKPVVHCDSYQRCIYLLNANPLRNTRKRHIKYDFDAVYGPESTQDDVYELVEPLINSVLDGINATIFAYGQTGTGKTYTMDGSVGAHGTRGIIWRSLEQIFSYIEHSDKKKKTFTVKASYMEIYGEVIRDLLLHGPKCEIREEKKGGGIYVSNLTKVICKSAREIKMAVERGSGRRATASTAMNDVSSRSHAILQVEIIVDIRMNSRGLKKLRRTSKLNLVDLAGSERQNKTETSGIRLKEASMTNKSLSCLGNVISALSSQKNVHIPYRDSKLTRILEDSLGGNSKTLVFANVGPAEYNYEETHSTLMYATRTKKIVNKPRKNVKIFGPDGKKCLPEQELLQTIMTALIEYSLCRQQFIAWRKTNPKYSTYDTKIVRQLFDAMPVSMYDLLRELQAKLEAARKDDEEDDGEEIDCEDEGDDGECDETLMQRTME